MSSVPLMSSDSGLLDGLYAAGFVGGGHGHDDLSKLLDRKAQEKLDAAAEEVTKKKNGGGDRAEKAATALKNHSEAERRRRERINAHLSTLRGIVPCTDKMDKAALLAEVITHVKKLKTNAARVVSRCPVPADADEVTVELVRHDTSSSSSSSSSHGSGSGGGFLVKATLSCDDGADLFADVKHALQPLRLKVVGSEVTTLGGRVRFTFLMSPACGGDGEEDVTSVESVHQALQSVIDKANSALEFAPRASLLNKRRRVSTFESSSSSS
ncbi:hypothetical protein PR202_ga24167 [Eleusine coracana subsp. coracana]|uniref:BHLH domain-containing protein n=1 Tax=Eleusine coracana subsp. coracana TaxID=191504 RepID=A0AAV5D7N3_ELECO|nr:hypothetical protein QOZ80_1BG0050400 [Eleusine coracana subsp. coracana]GJN06438.1 hypothetical protein PR202_ga24167 [Eleusine coracana subsp. coracana]